MPITPESHKQGVKTLRENYQDRRRRVGLGTQRNCVMWGYNTYGQMAVNDIVPRSSPIAILGDGWIHVTASSNESWGVKSDGTLWAWGYNAYGQLGQNNLNYYSSPVQITSGVDWADFSFIESNTPSNFHFFRKKNGTLWGVGHNSHGVLGLNDSVNRSSPVQVGSASTGAGNIGNKEWDTFTIANHSAVGIAKTDKSLWGWGYNGHGQLGILDGAYNQHRSNPTQLVPGTTWKDASISSNTFCGIKTDGTLWTMGYNNHGQLGTNDTVPRSSPTQIGAATDWEKCSVEGNHVIATRSGNIYTWGYNNHGQLGLQDTTPRSSPNHASYSHTNGMIRDVVGINNRSYMKVGIATITGYEQWYGVGHDSSYQHLMDGMRGEGTGAIDRSSPVPVGPYWTDFIFNDNFDSLDFPDYYMNFTTNNNIAYNKAD